RVSTCHRGRCKGTGKAKGRNKKSRAMPLGLKTQIPTTPRGDYIFDTSRFGLLGQGAHAVVIRAKHKDTGESVAVKVVGKDFDPREAQLLIKLDHPSIVHMFDLQQDANNTYIITELCRGGELFDLIAEHGPLPHGLARHCMIQLFEGIQYLHSKGVVHWDLKPENLLLTEDFNLKIADFGFAAMGSKAPTRPRGTIPYMAPEFVSIWTRKPSSSQHEQDMKIKELQKNSKLDPKKADMWGCGVVLYCVLAGTFPWRAPTPQDKTFKLHAQGKWIPKIHEENADILKLILALLSIDPKQRPSAAECLESKWLAFRARKVQYASTYFDDLGDLIEPPSNRLEIAQVKKGRKRPREPEEKDSTEKRGRYVACKTQLQEKISEAKAKIAHTPEVKLEGPKDVELALPVKRLGWVLPGKSVKHSLQFLAEIGKAVSEVGFDAVLDEDDFFVVARDEAEDKDMFLVTLFQQEIEGKPPALLLDVQRLLMSTYEFNEAYRHLRVALKELNAWMGVTVIASE
ncbi:hypothetical protein AAMO2058_000486900, partial [Amorphochlora amoebiformis]